MTDESDRDKLLAEGPRMAPEARTADGFAPSAPAEPSMFDEPVEQPSTSAEQAKPPLLKTRPPGSGSQGSWFTASLLRRLIPLLLVLVVLGRGLAGGRSGSWAFALVWVVAAVVIVVVRMRGRRRW
jgi:hypothetical protein